MIRIEQLKKNYGSTTVLDIPELHISPGQRFGLVGNNGAGKTTLFSLLLDLVRATSGKVTAKGLDVAKTEDWKSYTGAFIDDSFLIGFLTPEEYFEFVGQLYGFNRSDVQGFLQRFEDFFKGEILDSGKYIRSMSKGNKKKIGIVAALIGEPELVVLDEPFANLDPSSQIRLKQLLRELPEDKTVLISSHDLAHITEVCERIVVLEQGRAIQDIEANADTLKTLEAYFSA